MTVEGVVLADPAAPPLTGVLHVLVEDTGRADAPAVVVARLDVPVRLVAGDPVAFVLDTPGAPPGARWSVRVHADAGDTGAVQPGDQVSTEHVPATVGPVTVRLTRVRDPVGTPRDRPA